MKTEIQIVDEIIRLRNSIELMKMFIKDIKIDCESKAIYKEEIIKYNEDIERLEWVLGKEEGIK